MRLLSDYHYNRFGKSVARNSHVRPAQIVCLTVWPCIHDGYEFNAVWKAAAVRNHFRIFFVQVAWRALLPKMPGQHGVGIIESASGEMLRKNQCDLTVCGIFVFIHGDLMDYLGFLLINVDVVRYCA